MVEDRYTINVAERISSIIGVYEGATDLDEISVNYSFSHGYEKLTMTRNNHEIFGFAGSYHPNAICEGGEVCKWCGRTF